MPRSLSYWTKEETERFFAAIPPDRVRDRLLFNLMYRYALRRCEVGLIRTDDLKPGRIWITRVKGGISGEYPIYPSTQQLLSAYLEKRRFDGCRYLLRGKQHRPDPLSVSTIYLLFRRYAVAADMPLGRRNPHVLRHSLAVHLMNAGWDAADVQDWLGHSRISSTMIYARVTSRRREENYERTLTSEEIAAA